MLPFFILNKCKHVFSLFCCGSPVEAKGTLRRGLSQGSGWAHVMQAEGWGGGSTPEFGGAGGGAPGECAVGCQRLSERFCFRSARRCALCPPGRGCRGGRRRGRELRAGPFLVRCPAKRFGAPAEAPGPVGARGEDTTQVRASGTCRQHSLEPSVPGCHQLCAEELARLS